MLEHLYPLKLLERSNIFAFILGIAYSIIGIGLAVILFPEDPAIVSLAFISLMILPTLNLILRQEEELESTNDDFNLINFYKDHRDIFKIYLLLFIGVVLAFAFLSLFLPRLATNHIFKNQIEVLYGNTGNAVFQWPLFKQIFANNLSVLVLCFMTAFLFGDGAIFLITWNASVWGTIFGNLAKTAALNVNKDPFIYFLIVIVVVLPHMMLEAFSYISSATAGSVISRGLIREKAFSEKFNRIITNTLILIIFTIIILVIAVAVETYVLGNVEVYQLIIRQSHLA